jgi:hypothetical protein
MKRRASFVKVFGPNHNLGVVTVRIASISAVSVWINVSWIGLDDALDPVSERRNAATTERLKTGHCR